MVSSPFLPLRVLVVPRPSFSTFPPKAVSYWITLAKQLLPVSAKSCENGHTSRHSPWCHHALFGLAISRPDWNGVRSLRPQLRSHDIHRLVLTTPWGALCLTTGLIKLPVWRTASPPPVRPNSGVDPLKSNPLHVTISHWSSSLADRCDAPYSPCWDCQR